MLTVISGNRAPGEAGNNSGYILEKARTHYQARKTNFEHVGRKSSRRLSEIFFLTDCKSNCLRIGLITEIFRTFGDYVFNIFGFFSPKFILSPLQASKYYIDYCNTIFYLPAAESVRAVPACCFGLYTRGL